VAADDGLTDADLDIYQAIQGRPIILVINKQDLIADGAHLTLKDRFRELPSVMLSAKFNRGIDRLKESIVQQVMQDPNMVAGDVNVPQLRHLQIFVECLNRIENALQEMHQGLGPEMFVSHLQRAYGQLGQVLGQDTGEDVLDQIFDRFCIGK
jgi:tRNA modification GTPase